MKRLFMTQLTQISAKDLEGVGSLRYERYGVYRWVQNKNSGDLYVGNVASHSFGDGANFDEKVYEGVTVNLAAMAGVVMATTFTDDYYGWIQVFGYAPSVLMHAYNTTVIAAGGVLLPVDGEVHASLSTPMDDDIRYVRHIISLEALASTITIATLKKGFVHCM